ncbi:MAG: ABC-F family ATP-binding cassette domain-containing protein [Bacteroidetes bacterium]|nr:ABC-F family ATP-binding cassette domain-containing protein [Bacteroidota bacterium]
MHYLSVEGLSKSFGAKPLFSNITLNVSEGDKVGLIAKNGAGKSTLLNIISGRDTAENGKVWVHKDVKVCFLDQEPVFDPTKTVVENIFDHKHPMIDAVKEYEALMEDENPDPDKLTEAMGKMDELNAWDFESKVHQILGRLKIGTLTNKAGQLSGGQKKRLALAKTLIDVEFDASRKLLIMDEPTNHLDFDMIEWLENFLADSKMTLLLVTHDRYFLDSVCNEIMELTPGELYTYTGDYEYFLEKKAEREATESASVDKARNLMRKELEWMRKQPKARTTKSKSRIDAFYELQTKAAGKTKEQELLLNVKMSRLGGKILELKKVYKAYGDKKILNGFDYTFKKGDRIGIIGENGVGKTTFLNILMGIENPDTGKINVGDTIVFGYFDQKGLRWKEDKRVIEYVKDIAEHFPLANGDKVSATKFLELFQFTPEQQFTFISKLSGGEKKRLQLLAILFNNPNFLILDEPTNDLDLITLQVLEDFLLSYQGCVIIVSHDRYFMDKLVDHLFVFEGKGVIRDFPGNYTLYRFYKDQEKKTGTFSQEAKSSLLQAEPEVKEEKPAPKQESAPSKKMTFKEKFEFETLEKELPALTKERDELNEKIASGSLPYEELQKVLARIAEVTGQLEEKELRWLELSEKTA